MQKTGYQQLRGQKLPYLLDGKKEIDKKVKFHIDPCLLQMLGDKFYLQ